MSPYTRTLTIAPASPSGGCAGTLGGADDVLVAAEDAAGGVDQGEVVGEQLRERGRVLSEVGLIPGANEGAHLCRQQRRKSLGLASRG
jgi:hypothetical protein